jgi:hypothetical protein
VNVDTVGKTPHLPPPPPAPNITARWSTSCRACAWSPGSPGTVRYDRPPQDLRHTHHHPGPRSRRPPWPDAVRKHAGETDAALAYPMVLGECQYYLRELSRIIDRLTEGD